jgi:CcmD family protein
MSKIVKICWALSVSPLTPLAQEVEMADSLRSSGKIYVVVAIVLVILLGLIGYLISLDRKVSRLEKRLPEAKK